MNRQIATQTHQQKPTTTPAAGGLLQRKCACGNHTIAGGECAECSKKQGLGLQTKLKVNEPGDIYEQEADRIADQVLTAPANPAVSGASPHIQRFTGQPTGQDDTAPASVDRVLASTGRPLGPALQQDMEQRFGHDFSRVRVHSGAVAEQSARKVRAHAYTVGTDIVFGAGRFAPGTHEGRRLIAHELTHVVQQSGSDGIRVDSSNEKRGLSPISLRAIDGLADPERERLSHLRESYFSGDHERAAHIVRSNKGRGTPLAPGVQLRMKDYLGHDFGGVRVHTDSFAVQAAESLRANAFTLQGDIFFAASMYAADRPGGLQRLAHELTHTIQQRETGGPPSRQRIDNLEDQAEHAAVWGLRGSSGLNTAGPCILREPTAPRAATGDEMTTEVARILSTKPDKGSKDETVRLWSSVKSNFPGSTTAGSLARQVWTYLFLRHFVEPDTTEGAVESAHPRYMFSNEYGWIDAQHFFGFIDFTEQFHVAAPKKRKKTFEKATKKGLQIEETQEKVRQHVVKPPPSTMAEETEERMKKERVETIADKFLLITAFPPLDNTNTMIEVFKLLNDEQKEKFWIDAAKSAFTYEDFQSNQLGIRFFFEHGVKINELPEKTRQSEFISSLGNFFKSIKVENDRKKVIELAKSLPGKERFNAPKTTEEQVRKEHPDLFKLP